MRRDKSFAVPTLLTLVLILALGGLALQAERPGGSAADAPRPSAPEQEARDLKGNGPFDCALGCSGELGQGNSCVESTDCTPAQLNQCLPGFPMCDEHGSEHDEHDEHDEHSASAGASSTPRPAPGF